MKKTVLLAIFFLFVNKITAQTNNPPQLTNPFDDRQATEDQYYSFSFAPDLFTDPDEGDEISYDAQLSDGGSLPVWLSFDNTSRTFSGTPLNEDVGTITIRITATDLAGATGTFDFNLTVENVNDAPYTAGTIENTQIQEDQSFEYNIGSDIFADDDLYDTLSLSAQLQNGNALPVWLLFDEKKGTFSGTPENDAVGFWDIEVIATDLAGEKTQAVFTIEVLNVNDSPEVIGTIASLTAYLNTEFSFTVPNDIFQDIDEGDELTLSAQLSDGNDLPAWLSFDNTTNTFLGTPDTQTEYTIQLTATDIAGETASTTFKLSVEQTTGINTLTKNEIKVYPNPSSGTFTVNIDDFTVPYYQIAVVNIKGETVFESRMQKSAQQISLKNASSGTYFLLLTNRNSRITKQILIK